MKKVNLMGSGQKTMVPSLQQEIEGKTMEPSGSESILASTLRCQDSGSMARTVLVADDDDRIREMIELVLSRAGYNILSACDGLEAVKIYQEHGHKVDLVILDMVMPNMNGEDAYFTIREMNDQAAVLLISGDASPVLIKKLLDDGAQDFVSKPFELDDLLASVKQCILDSGVAIPAQL